MKKVQYLKNNKLLYYIYVYILNLYLMKLDIV